MAIFDYKSYSGNKYKQIIITYKLLKEWAKKFYNTTHQDNINVHKLRQNKI